jgi:hypothetical protein
MAFMGMPRVLVLVQRYRLWQRMSVAEFLRSLEKRGALHFSATQNLAITICNRENCRFRAYSKKPVISKFGNVSPYLYLG